jgi:hypothetical protein
VADSTLTSPCWLPEHAAISLTMANSRNFTLLDVTRTEIASLLAAMLQAREAAVRRSWSHPQEPTAPTGLGRRRPQSSAPAHGQNGLRRLIRPEHVGAVDGEQLHEPLASPMDPALDRPYRALADSGGLLVGEA